MYLGYHLYIYPNQLPKCQLLIYLGPFPRTDTHIWEANITQCLIAICPLFLYMDHLINIQMVKWEINLIDLILRKVNNPLICK